MTHDDIIHELESIKKKKELTFDMMSAKSGLGVSTIKKITVGDNVGLGYFIGLCHAYGIMVDLKKTRMKIIEHIPEGFTNEYDLAEESGVSGHLMGKFLMGVEVGLYTALDIMAHFGDLEFEVTE